MASPSHHHSLRLSKTRIPIRMILIPILSIIFDRVISQQSLPNEYAFNNRVIEKSASCDRSYIYFSIAFAKPFLGLVYTDGTFGSQRCMYVNGSSFSQIKYNITIPLNECRSQTFPNGTSQNVVVVQRDWRILEASDNLFVISCNSAPTSGPGSSSGLNSAGQGGKFTLSFAGITVQGTLASTEVVTSSFSDIDYTAEVLFGTGSEGRKLDRPLGVGESISYVVRLRKLRTGQVDARIGRCWATDGLPSSSVSGNTEIQLSDDDGCTVLPGSNIWNNFRTAPLNEAGQEGKILYNEIKAWAFPTSNRVNIFCNLHLCPNSCPPSPCKARDEKTSQSPPSFTTSSVSTTKNTSNRPRRTADNDAIDGDRDVISVSTGFDIFPDRRTRDESSIQKHTLLVTAGLKTDDPNGIDQKYVRHEQKSLKTVCLTHTNFVIGVSLLLIIITLSFIFIVALLCKLSRPVKTKRLLYGQRIRRFLSTRSSSPSFQRRSDTIHVSDGDSESAVTCSTIGRNNR